MQSSEKGLDARQLLHITKNCRRWSGIESLPPPVRKALEKFDALTERLQVQSASKKGMTGILCLVVSNCDSLRAEFSKAQIPFDCPSCPMRAMADAGLEYQ